MQKNSVELLAPVGRWDVLESVISAGADAVYLGSKKFNMRLHRSDYNFTDEQLVSAVNFAHKHNVKVYITINNLLSNSEINELHIFLEFLQDIEVDAIIIQDLGVLRLAQEMNLKLSIHSSTMMNTHSVPMAIELKDLGINRIIVSRDITIAQAKEIHEKCNIEVEYFVHGDMCSAQSSQCYSSGVLFGKSSNRGECMKPCRWKYTLVEEECGECFGEVNEGHFLAMSDICLLQHIPSLVQAGICSFKIEGRMRDAKYLKEIVSIYRRSIDSYFNAPSFYYANKNDVETVFKTRVRNLSTSVSFALAQQNTFDFSGDREPLFLSKFAKERHLVKDDLHNNPFRINGLKSNKCKSKPCSCENNANENKEADPKASIDNCAPLSENHNKLIYTCCKETDLHINHELMINDKDVYSTKPVYQSKINKKKLLSVKVGSLSALKIAIAEGADNVYLNGDISPRRGQTWTLDLLKEANEIAHDKEKKIGLCTPRITTDREIGDLRCLLESVKGFGWDFIVVHNLGSLRVTREFGFNITTDFSFNLLNTYATSLLKSTGVKVSTLSIESSFNTLCGIASSANIDVECIVHGQLPFMVLEHCLPAIIVTRSNANGVCRQPCRHVNYALSDENGEIRPIEVDQYCRNHIFFASDLCVLPYINSFIKTDINSFRIEAQYYNDDLIATIVKLYRKQIDIFDYNSDEDYTISDNEWNELIEKSPRKFSLGAYNHCIFHSKKTVEVLRSLN